MAINFQNMDINSGHILIVDDNVLNRKLLERALQELGHTTVTAENGRIALALLRGHPPEKDGAQWNLFDVVLLDILMPELDGYQTLAEIKADPELKHIPVIMISGLDEIDSVVRCIEMGAEDYLNKPFNPLLLAARLSASLEKKKLRDLERAYLQQEVALRQSEKLATLGKLSAGMAHELNNPAAAARRGIGQLGQAIRQWQAAILDLARDGLSSAQLTMLHSLDQQAQTVSARPLPLDPVARSEQEGELEFWLEERQVENPWEISPTLVCLGCSLPDLARLEESFGSEKLHSVLAWVNAGFNIYSLLEEIGQGAARVSAIVEALKSYAYLDQAPVVTVDMHESLDSTLALLAGRLDGGVRLHREYCADLPRLQAFGSELNQVWTHLLDNALDALDGNGELIVRTRWDGPWVVVEFEDNGPGIPEPILSKIFDPFFTTKPPGKGAGMGLSISHNIIVQKHGGQIGVHSRPGRTVFEVRLPSHLE